MPESSTHGCSVLTNEKFKKLREKDTRNSTNCNRSTCTANAMQSSTITRICFGKYSQQDNEETLGQTDEESDVKRFMSITMENEFLNAGK